MGLPFIGVTPSGVLACMSRPEHALPPEGQQLPHPVGGPSIRVSSCRALCGGHRYGVHLGGGSHRSWDGKWHEELNPMFFREGKLGLLAVSRKPVLVPSLLTGSGPGSVVWHTRPWEPGPDCLYHRVHAMVSHTSTALFVYTSPLPRTCLFLVLQASVSMPTYSRSCSSFLCYHSPLSFLHL